MAIVLVLSAIPAVMAAGFDSLGLALLAAAGLVWAAALYVCSVAPVVAWRQASITESVATGLSTAAAVTAIAGLVMIALSAL